MAEDIIDDITYIKEIHGHEMDELGFSDQFDILLDARGYGWDYMLDWADYMASSDIDNLSESGLVRYGTIGGNNLQAGDVSDSYCKHGGKCTQTPELKFERGSLSICGHSRALGCGVQIIWYNQTRCLTLQILGIARINETLARKYFETMVRRTFGTPDGMKLAKPQPDEKKEDKPEEASDENFSNENTEKNDEKQQSPEPETSADTANIKSEAKPTSSQSSKAPAERKESENIKQNQAAKSKTKPEKKPLVSRQFLFHLTLLCGFIFLCFLMIALTIFFAWGWSWNKDNVEFLGFGLLLGVIFFFVLSRFIKIDKQNKNK